ncbi:MAG: hypothetical protein O3A63_09085 [Proteobacteria bacterium]|nr:hypothetical protein [Pseudomonadota bacterium]
MKGLITIPRLLLGFCLLLPIGSAQADDPRAAGNVYYRWVDVVDVRPVHTLAEVSVPTQTCVEPDQPAYAYDQRHRHQHDYDEYAYDEPASGFASLLGGLIGGLIGNQFGGGNGKTALTVAGAITGAAIAGSVRRGRAEPAAACHVEYEKRTIQRVQAYDVTYTFNGQEYHKRTSTHAGERIRIRLEVTPNVSARPIWSDTVQVSFIVPDLPLTALREIYQYV